MGWVELVTEIDRRYSFLGRIKATRNGLTPASLHPVLKFSTGLVVNAIYAEKPERIVLLFPSRFSLDKWITVLSVLDLLKKDYQNKESDVFDFQPGQKLLLNDKYVVEFEGKADGKIWIKASDGSSRIGLNIGRLLQFQPTTRQRLSPVKKVWGEYNNAPQVPVDSILDIYTAGNKLLFESNIIYVGRIGHSIKFLNEVEINNTRLLNLFLWGKLNTEGYLSIISPARVQASPSCIIAGELYSLVNYVKLDEDKSKAVVISDPSFCKNDPQSFNALLDSKIPIVVIADFNDLDDLESLVENEFKIWQWNERNLVEISKEYHPERNSIFTPFHRTLTNLCNQKIDTMICHYPELEAISDELFLVERKISDDNDELKSLFSQLYQLFNDFIRLIRFPSEEWLNNFQLRITNLRHEFKTQRSWIQTEAMSQLNNIFSSLLQLSYKPFVCENHKLDQLETLLQQISISEKIIIILPRYEDIEVTKNYWQKRFSKNPEKLNNVEFLTAGDLSIDSLTSVPQRIIVCGWLGQGLMYSILHSFITDKITLLVYSKEATWFKRAAKRWRKKRGFNSNAKDFEELLKLPEDSLDSFDSQIEAEPERPEELQEEDIVEFERRLKRYRYSRYKASSNTTDVIEKAKPIIFNDEHLAFFTKTHKSLVVTDLILNTNPEAEIQKLTVSDLKVEDHILFFSSDRDLIREVADIKLKESDKGDLRSKATFWKYLLRKRTEEVPFDAVVEILRRHGCKRHEMTIKNWLIDDDIIGPAYQEDLRIILLAFTNPGKRDKIDELLNEITQAISEVRGAHLKASSILAQQLIAELPNILAHKDRIAKPLTIDLPEFGRVFILRIEEIGNEWIDIEKRNINRLLN